MIKLWCCAYGYYVCVGDWLVDQVDHNDYFVGGLIVFNVMMAAKLAGWL